VDSGIKFLSLNDSLNLLFILSALGKTEAAILSVKLTNGVKTLFFSTEICGFPMSSDFLAELTLLDITVTLVDPVSTLPLALYILEGVAKWWRSVCERTLSLKFELHYSASRGV
jgi:hypothetical protein